MLILQENNNENMILSESFKSGVLIAKLPASIALDSFKSYLKHKKKKMIVDDVMLKLRIEENNIKADRKRENVYALKANVVEHG